MPLATAAVSWMHTVIPGTEEIVGREYVIEPIRSDLELQVIDKLREGSD